MTFLTYNDNYSGIYKSQVIDVCSFIENEFNEKVKLVAFVSMRNYSGQKKLIKENYQNAVVLPMFPKVQFWKMNIFLLFFTCLFSGSRKIWARGPFACNLAISMKKIGLAKKVLFDARGAYLAELTEYDVVQNESVKSSISFIEKKALTESDSQLAVSAKLAEWWKDQYDFIPVNFSIIPCTLSSYFSSLLPPGKEMEELKKALGFSKDDIVLVYSGSSAGWQSFNLVDDYLYTLINENRNLKIIFLSDTPPVQSKVFSHFKERVITKWVQPQEVRNLLLAADYGLLIREESITNKVASPVKFAEYLSCGLQIIISEGIGDFTDFVKSKNCGFIYTDANKLVPVSQVQKENNNKLALAHFSKRSAEIREGYKKLFNA
jgi:hypothetical protein